MEMRWTVGNVETVVKGLGQFVVVGEVTVYIQMKSDPLL